MSVLIDTAERGLVPDFLVRRGIRFLIGQRLSEERDAGEDRRRRLIDELSRSRIALHTDSANEQHYEVPARFFELVLGARLKYSSAFWDAGTDSLDEAEERMLDLTARRAEIGEGQAILDLGCGWGSFTLWAAARYPSSTFTAVSNSRSQREHIEMQARSRGLSNVRVLTGDVNEIELDMVFDRIVSVEMFEHVRNYAALLNKIRSWLKPTGKLFVHIFCHRYLVYPFETTGDANWMGRYFFTGGLMPAADTLLHFQDDVRIEERWQMSGSHYQRTARAWLDNMDARSDAVRHALAPTYGAAAVDRWMQRWRFFFMACEELFGYADGAEWLVCHYRFGRR